MFDLREISNDHEYGRASKNFKFRKLQITDEFAPKRWGCADAIAYSPLLGEVALSRRIISTLYTVSHGDSAIVYTEIVNPHVLYHKFNNSPLFYKVNRHLCAVCRV